MSIIEEMNEYREEQRKQGSERIWYPAEMKARARVYIREQRAQRRESGAVAEELGVSLCTVQRWHTEASVGEEIQGSPPAVLRAVRLKHAPVMLRRMVAMVGSDGVLRIEGSAAEMSELVRGLRR